MRVLITGASGFVGRKLMTSFAKHEDEVLGTYFKNPYPDLEKLDVTDTQAVKDLFERYKPDLVIHAGAMGRPDECQSDPELAYKINVGGTKNIVDACEDQNAFLVFPSSVYVFDGLKQGEYGETDKPNPINVYGKTKAEAEEVVRSLSHYIIIRSDMMIGYNGEGFRNGLVGVIANSEKTVLLDNVNLRQPFFVDDLEPAITTLLDHDKTGIFHLGGNERITQYDLGIRFEELIRGHSILEPRLGEPLAPRPRNLSINSARARNEGIVFTPLDSAIQIIKEQQSGIIGPEGALLSQGKERLCT